MDVLTGFNRADARDIMTKENGSDSMKYWEVIADSFPLPVGRGAIAAPSLALDR